MKKIFVIVIGVCISCFALFAKDKSIKVDNTYDFVNAIGPNRTIILEGSTLFLHEIEEIVYQEGQEQYCYLEEAFDGAELVIRNVKNLKIVGKGNRPVRVITRPQYGNVLSFENCENISLENLELGHGPQKAYCTGGVVRLENCKNIKIKNSVLFGCGTEGITADNVEGLECVNSTIRNCSYGIMTITKSKDFTFKKCSFYDNQEFSLINIYESRNLLFEECRITNNLIHSEHMKSVLFFLARSKGVSVKKTLIESNFIDAVTNNEVDLILEDVEIQNNMFQAY